MLERFQQGLQLCFGSHFNQRSAQEVMGLQSCGSPNFENFRTPNLGVPWQHDIWVLTPWLGIENTIREKVVTSPKSSCGEFCESAFIRGSFVHQKCSNYALTKLLFDLCKSMWIIDSLVICPSPHPRASTLPFTPKWYEPRNVLNSLSFHYFHLRFTFEFIKELGSVSHCQANFF